MADYAEQLNRARRDDESIGNPETPETDEESFLPVSEITAAEWLIIGAVAILADLLGPIGVIFLPIILLWHTIRFHKLPFKKIIGASAFEVISVGLLPGWTGFVIWTFLEQKGYLPGWLSNLTKGTGKI